MAKRSWHVAKPSFVQIQFDPDTDRLAQLIQRTSRDRIIPVMVHQLSLDVARKERLLPLFYHLDLLKLSGYAGRSQPRLTVR